MRKRKGKAIGILLLTLVIIITVFYGKFFSTQRKEVALHGLLGGEKIGLFENSDFQKMIEKKYRLKMDYRKAGSLAMVRETAQSGNAKNDDYLFPSSQLALELYKKEGGSYVQEDFIFNTPIVLYSRRVVVDALIKEGIVRENDGVSYVNMEKLSALIAKGTPWADLGLSQLYGNIFIDTTDPNKSNSGNMFLGLLANSLNGGKVLTLADADRIIPQLQSIYQQIGAMQGSSSDLFSQYLKLGVGSYPIIAGYESQILEFSKVEPEIFKQIKDELVILYPQPTVWSSHIFIALTDQGQRGLEALKDPEVQSLAWKNHGFRTVVSGTENTDEFQVKGIPKSVNSVMPMPSIDVMLKLMESLPQ